MMKYVAFLKVIQICVLPSIFRTTSVLHEGHDLFGDSYRRVSLLPKIHASLQVQRLLPCRNPTWQRCVPCRVAQLLSLLSCSGRGLLQKWAWSTIARDYDVFQNRLSCFGGFRWCILLRGLRDLAILSFFCFFEALGHGCQWCCQLDAPRRGLKPHLFFFLRLFFK